MTGTASVARLPAPRWAEGVAVPSYLALRDGSVPVVVVAPHGGRRSRPHRPGDSVNDLFTAEIAWEVAERLDAFAIVNDTLDRNEVDLNRISHLAARAPEVLALLRRAVGAASRVGAAPPSRAVPLVLFVHGWNMVVPCCDVGVGLRRRGGRLVGRFPTLRRERFEALDAVLARTLGEKGIVAAVGRRYAASGKDNAAQLFSGRHADHDTPDVAALAELALAGRVDAAQLELGIPLRWPGRLRQEFIAALVEALADGDVAAAARVRPVGSGANARVWTSTPDRKRAEESARASEEEPGVALTLQAVLDRDGSRALFCGFETAGPEALALRCSVVCTDGTMALVVGEGPWDGNRRSFGIEGVDWTLEDGGRTLRLRMSASMVRYPTHEAYLDLEQGLAGSVLVRGEAELRYRAETGDHGRLTGRICVGDDAYDVDTVAFVDRRSRWSGARERVRLLAPRPWSSPAVLRSDDGVEVRIDPARGALGSIVAGPVAGSGERESIDAEILARVPVWRPHGDGAFSRWTFGVVRCRAGDRTGEEFYGLFDSLEVFRRPPRGSD